MGKTAAINDEINGINSHSAFFIQNKGILDYKRSAVYILTQFFHVLQMIIKYTNFSDGIHSFRLSESVKNLGLEELFFGNADVECKMDKSPHQIVLNCDLTVHSKMICDRCAKDLETKLTNHFQISYIFSRDLQETDEYNVKYLSPEDDKINIRNDVYEYAELALPMKRLCKDDCKGLCPHCGINLNEEQCNCKIEKTHDVWEPLKQLKGKFNN